MCFLCLVWCRVCVCVCVCVCGVVCAVKHQRETNGHSKEHYSQSRDSPRLQTESETRTWSCQQGRATLSTRVVSGYNPCHRSSHTRLTPEGRTGRVRVCTLVLHRERIALRTACLAMHSAATVFDKWCVCVCVSGGGGVNVVDFNWVFRLR
jgi:hypothetical protein